VTEPVALVERRGHTMILTINRPEVRNAVNAEVVSIIGAALEEADTDNSVWAVVITGAGDKSFCAGADLKAIARGERPFPDGMEHWSFAGFANHFISKPTIAAVNGFAMGGGTELVLASDLAIAAETATFGLPEVKRGMIAAAGGAFRIPRQVPRKVGMHMLLTGEPISARTALEYGLVNSVVPAGQALDAALELAELVCANSPLAVQGTKRIAYGATAGAWTGEVDYWALTGRESGALRNTEDGQEGPRAFAEKRPPQWKGR
jgi:crotonobetainyl-CoA hydratase